MVTTVTGFTSDRMLAIENGTVVDGNVVGDNLILLTHGGTPIDAGNVRGPQGIQGPIGEISQAELDAAIAAATAAGAITGVMLANGAVTEDKIASAAVTAAKMAVAAVTSPSIAVDAIMQAHLQDACVGTPELIDAAVTAVKLASGAVTTAKIGDSQVTTAKIANLAVDLTKIANSTIDTTKIANSAASGIIDNGVNGAVAYIKILNWVFLKGDACAPSSTWGTLPSAYRPNKNLSFPCTNETSPPDVSRVIVLSTGVINVPNPAGAGSVVDFVAAYPTTGL